MWSKKGFGSSVDNYAGIYARIVLVTQVLQLPDRACGMMVNTG